MAGPNVAEEFISIDGIVATGEYGVAVAPENATDALDPTWHDHGLTTDAGVTRSQPVSRTTRRAWQKSRKLRTVTTEAAVRFAFILVQTTKENVQLFHGMPLVAGSVVTDPSREWPLIAFDLDMIDDESTEDDVIREYAPQARVVEVGDQVALAGDGVGWPITVEAEYNTELGGYTQRFFSKFEGLVPTISTALPTAQAAGEIIRLVGTGFQAATAVTIGGVAATSFDAPNDTEMYVTLPAGSAGSAPVIVTGPAGPSTAKAYTRA